ncbi:MAG: type I 3-dehydroquinate dehydratase [Nitrososphaerales archaeon]
MSNTDRKLCVSLAGADFAQLEQKVKQARRFHPGFLEFRIDYLDKSINSTTIMKLRALLNGDEIITLRSRSEGGRFTGGEDERVYLIRKILKEVRPKVIDIEIETLRNNPDLLEDVRKGGSKLIASHHSLNSRPDVRKLEKIISSIPKAKPLYAVKIVLKATVFKDNLTVLSLYNSKKVSRLTANLIAFCVGPLGVYSRIECISLGSPLTYTSLPGEAVASGQLDIETMRNVLALRK